MRTSLKLLLVILILFDQAAFLEFGSSSIEKEGGAPMPPQFRLENKPFILHTDNLEVRLQSLPLPSPDFLLIPKDKEGNALTQYWMFLRFSTPLSWFPAWFCSGTTSQDGTLLRLTLPPFSRSSSQPHLQRQDNTLPPCSQRQRQRGVAKLHRTVYHYYQHVHCNLQDVNNGKIREVRHLFPWQPFLNEKKETIGFYVTADVWLSSKIEYDPLFSIAVGSPKEGEAGEGHDDDLKNLVIILITVLVAVIALVALIVIAIFYGRKQKKATDVTIRANAIVNF